MFDLFRRMAVCALIAVLSTPSFGQFVASVDPANKPDRTDPSYIMPPGKIYIDTSTIPGLRPGYSGPRIRQQPCVGTISQCNDGTSAPNIKPDQTVEDGGDFRIDCFFSHASFDDPIVWPGRPGVTHLHQFFGNERTASATDLLTMAISGNSTCQGGTLNRTGYWTPTLVYHCPAGSTNGCTRSRDGEVIAAMSGNFYYKTAGEGSVYRRANYAWAPPGMRVIAGDASSMTPEGHGGDDVRFACNNQSGNPRPRAGLTTGSNAPFSQFAHIPSTDEVADMDQCSDLNVLIPIPLCWDGVNIDSPDHRSHVSRANFYAGCDTPENRALGHTHTLVNGVSFNVHFPVNREDLSYLRASSDTPASSGLPGGHSMHGDWLNGWTSQSVVPVPGATKSVTDLILDTCLRRPSGKNGSLVSGADCHNGLVGNADGDPTHWFYLY